MDRWEAPRNWEVLGRGVESQPGRWEALGGSGTGDLVPKSREKRRDKPVAVAERLPKAQGQRGRRMNPES